MHESKAKLLSYVPQGRVLTLQLDKNFEPPDGELKVTLCKWREQRSRDANAKFWKLCGELSAVVGRPPEDIYRDYIKDIGGNYEVVPIKEEAVLKWARNWASRGIGWVCEILDKSKHPGYTNMISYYGSSTYDTAQMSRLLNFLIEDCKAQGIETLSPDELERLLSLWENQNIA